MISLHRIVLTLVFLVLSAVAIAPVSAQTGVTALLFGRIVDDKTSESRVGVSYKFMDGDKVAAKGKSTTDGKFQAVLKPGKTYTLYIDHFDILPEKVDFVTRESSSYYEENREFRVRRLVKGDQLASWNLFAPKDSVLGNTAAFDYFLELMNRNRSLSLVVQVSGAIPVEKGKGKGKSKKVAAPKPKKGKKSAPPAPNPEVVLTEARTRVITAHITTKSPSLLKRIIVEPAPAQQSTDIRLVCGEIKDPGTE